MLKALHFSRFKVYQHFWSRREAAKNIFFNGCAIKEGGGGKGRDIKEKRTFKKLFFRRPLSSGGG